jgi:putative oxygen-independent coproporphyrinogen III oxidase
MTPAPALAPGGPAGGPAGDARPAAGSGPGFGVYVHVPFCLTRCSYCDFVTYTGMQGLRRPYAAALLAEARLAVRERLGSEPPVVTSVFVGGGTPTLLPPAELARLLDGLRALLALAPDAEITVEANPETVDARVAEGLAGAAVTRVSLGAQSFDDRVLAVLERPHDARRTAAAVGHLHAAGLRELNLDLIYGSPGEDAGSWARTLQAALALGPAHVSAYALTVERATKFGRLVAAGRMRPPDDDVLADRYQAACATLAGAGLLHYEVSNWARGPEGAGGLPAHASRHNLTYWRRGGYLGLGAGAHEFTGGERRWNVASIPEYLAAVRAGRRPTAGSEHLDAAAAGFERLTLGLRTSEGLGPAAARALGVEPAGRAAAELRAAGLLAPGPRLALTEAGMFLHGEVVTRL